MSDDGGAAIEDYYLEERLFPPPEGFVEQAVVSDPTIAAGAEADVEGFWAQQAHGLDWFDEWHTVLEWNLPFARWFVGGTLNVSYNCLDRHVQAGLGDRVAIYRPMIPELPVAMLACTRIGAPHSVVFGGFSPDALRDRINDAQAKVLVTADGGWRRGAPVALKENADA